MSCSTWAGRIRRNLEAAQARFDGALAEYQKAALNSYREVANALVTIEKLAEQRGFRQASVTALLAVWIRQVAVVDLARISSLFSHVG